MTIEICSEKDIPSLVNVSIQSYCEHYRYLWNDEGEAYIAENFSASNFRRQLDDKNVAMFLIYDEEVQPCGFLKLNIDKAYENYPADLSLELERIYLINKVSGKGYGKKAMDFVTSFAKNKNKKFIWLKVMDSSPAVNFYKKEGFGIIGKWRLQFPVMKEEFRGMHVMVKETDDVTH